MNDDRVIAYLRSRAPASLPHDLVPAVLDALDGVPQRPSSWFAPYLPAAMIAGIAAAIAAVAFVLGQDASIGPNPSPSDAVLPTATERAAEPTATPSEAATTAVPSPLPADATLVFAGRTVELDIRSTEGVSGRITLRREMDVGGYPLIAEPSSETHFFIEVAATYELTAAPETASWGEVDWRVEDADGPVDVEFLRAVAPTGDRNALGTWPGATVPDGRYVGWLIFAVPRELADTPLELVYQPVGVAEAVRIPLRDPGEPPPPVAAEWPRPAPIYVERPGLPFTVLESAEADALFAATDTCTNPEAGYTVSYPDTWYTNTAIGDVPACTWFSPTFYEVTDDGRAPSEVAIQIDVFSGNVGFIWADLYSENITLDGIAARRYETGETVDPNMPTDRFAYSYLAYLDDVLEGRKLWASTGVDFGGEYELNKAVFDRIMASLEFTD